MRRMIGVGSDVSPLQSLIYLKIRLIENKMASFEIILQTLHASDLPPSQTKKSIEDCKK